MTVPTGCRAAVIVGGGAVGRAIGDRLAEAGARVAMVERPRGWKEAGSALAAVAEQWGGIDLLVNEFVEGAGDEPTGSFATAYPEAIAAGVEAVLPVAVATTRAALDVMVRWSRRPDRLRRGGEWAGRAAWSRDLRRRSGRRRRTHPQPRT